MERQIRAEFACVDFRARDTRAILAAADALVIWRHHRRDRCHTPIFGFSGPAWTRRFSFHTCYGPAFVFLTRQWRRTGPYYRLDHRAVVPAACRKLRFSALAHALLPGKRSF